MASGSPPETPPPDPVPLHHDITRSPSDNVQTHVTMTADNPIQADSRIENVLHNSTTHMSDRDNASIFEKNTVLPNSEFSQAKGMEPSTACVQGCT